MKVIGMISGTSFDAMEAVAIDVRLDGRCVLVELVAHVSVPYDDALRDRLARLLPPGETSIEEVCFLDTLIGQAFASVARDLSDATFAGEVDVVCSHGQTVFHWVDSGHALGTLQLGQAAWIAEATGATVVADVRARDVAAGGQGAPLVSLVDVLLLGRSPQHVRAALNLGGISNITIVSPACEPIAYDIGPANALMDAAMVWYSDGREFFDRDGALAAQGEIDDRLLRALLDEPYYRAPAPKSTGKELFHLDYLRRHLGERELSGPTVLATLCELTVRTVVDAVVAHGVRELFVSGGGTRNPVVMNALHRRLGDAGVTLGLIDEYGVPEAAKEALLFALIGFFSVQGLSASIASCTGARHAAILGAITLGRQPVVALGPEAFPTSLRVSSRGAS